MFDRKKLSKHMSFNNTNSIAIPSHYLRTKSFKHQRTSIGNIDIDTLDYSVLGLRVERAIAGGDAGGLRFAMVERILPKG